MAKKTYSREDLFGDIHHYDEKGRETGVSRRGVLGGYTDYDAKGKFTGTRRRSVLDADPRRLETTGSVYRRSFDPPRLFDDPGDPEGRGKADAPKSDTPHTGGAGIGLTLTGALMLFVLFLATHC